MAELRNPEGGCPWDLDQTFETIAPYTIEEAYEVADAIERKRATTSCATNWATCCCRSYITPDWPRRPALSSFADCG